MPRRQLGRAVASVPRRAAALKAPLARTGGCEGWAAGEGGDSPGVSDGAHSAQEAVHLSPGWTRGAGAARARAGPQDDDFETSATTPAFDASLLSGCASCCGTVALCFGPERTLEVRRFRRNCKKQNGEKKKKKKGNVSFRHFYVMSEKGPFKKTIDWNVPCGLKGDPLAGLLSDSDFS